MCSIERLCALLCAAALCGPALAADKPAKPPAPSARISTLGKGGPGSDQPLLTREQLRGCLAQQDRLKADEAALLPEQRDLDAEKAAVQEEGDALKSDLSTLDRTSASGVEVYNARAVAHDRRVDAYNARSKPFNARVDALAATRQGFERDCGNRRYKEDDLIFIQSGH